ncbi:hypothetical protein A2U01_0080943, partial [Trifolium medium]|nr:hypothetical protein [Trifolium medium]
MLFRVDVQMPHQRLQRNVAIRAARASCGDFYSAAVWNRCN